ncbi:hypothetical protein GGX14DRAFT_437621 [Mycena pura]|uniref:Uncharacterized protein n=1 Tax=Mycena pura TaxID=153505 RepID=A0AAD6VSN8_9AGAR|nr:hypothetical protein GGX14DRAFT_437621 [Mycena pura]
MPQPSLAADNNSCPWCLAHLAIQWCKSGPNKEKAFLVCDDIDFHPQRQPYWHWWGVVASRQARAMLSASPSPALSSYPSFSVASSSASTGLLPSSSTSSGAMAVTQGTSYCKQHCIMRNNGSCPVKTHDPATISQRQRRAVNVPPPARQRRALLSRPPASRTLSVYLYSVFW